MDRSKAARGSCHYARARRSTDQMDPHIVAQYERGSLVAGIVIAVSFGLMMLHWAVM